MEEQGRPPLLGTAIENLDSLLEGIAKARGVSLRKDEVMEKGLEDELDQLTTRLVKAMNNRASIEEVLNVHLIILLSCHRHSCCQPIDSFQHLCHQRMRTQRKFARAATKD